MTEDGTPFSEFRQFEKESWENLGDAYSQSFEVTLPAAAALLDAARVNAPGLDVLDVATGPGFVAAKAFRERGARATGLDFSSSMIRNARALYPEVPFVQGDAEALPFGDASFDAVTIGFGLLHFPNPEKALTECFRVLRPGGRLAFTVWDKPRPESVFGLINQSIAQYGDPHVALPPAPAMFDFSDADETCRVLELTGFKGVTVEPLVLLWQDSDPDALYTKLVCSSVRAGATVRAQTEEARARIRAGLRDMMVQRTGPDGVATAEMCALLVAAVKP